MAVWQGLAPPPFPVFPGKESYDLIMECAGPRVFTTFELCSTAKFKNKKLFPNTVIGKDPLSIVVDRLLLVVLLPSQLLRRVDRALKLCF